MLGSLALSLALIAVPPAPSCAAPAGAVCQPGADGELQAQLAPLLGGIDRPVPAGAWSRLPPAALPLLEALAEDPAALPTRRALALEGAAALGSDGAVHRRLAGDAAAPFLVRAAAIRVLTTTGTPETARRTLDGLLAGDPDRRVRAAAADALVRTDPVTACETVRLQVLRERTEARPAFRRAVAACATR